MYKKLLIGICILSLVLLGGCLTTKGYKSGIEKQTNDVEYKAKLQWDLDDAKCTYKGMVWDDPLYDCFFMKDGELRNVIIREVMGGGLVFN